MPCLRKRLDWKTLSWWLAVLAVALAIKHHYSIASAADLDWMLWPLSQSLEWISGHPFQRDSLHEWVSESADVRLVKGCAGINFLLMSLLAWAWVFAPERREDVDTPTWMAQRVLLLFAVIVAAWTSGLLANTLRILVAMNLPEHGTGLHRLVGLLIYVPLLSLQLHLGSRGNWKAALWGPVILYLLLMAVVPVLTGNAFNDPTQFIQHLVYLSAMTATMGGIYSGVSALSAENHAKFSSRVAAFAEGLVTNGKLCGSGQVMTQSLAAKSETNNSGSKANSNN
jgi:exosortase K